ncbi:hypothetical protein FRB97_000907 [Tulasnella sp. 331]|nr:hypothetical protein FRB97_000907 [Tulasnella sp. 331]
MPRIGPRVKPNAPQLRMALNRVLGDSAKPRFNSNPHRLTTHVTGYPASIRNRMKAAALTHVQLASTFTSTMTNYSGKLIKASPIPDCSSVILVEFARPPVNAFSEGMWGELRIIFDSISRDGAVRAVVLGSSLPKFWTAGLDLIEAAGPNSAITAPMGGDPSRRSLGLSAHILDFQDAISAIERCRQPVVAAVHGLALGLAVDILCACDIRYAAENSNLCIKVREVDIGMASDIGTLARISKIVGNESAVRELALTARPFGASEALSIGFVNKVVKGGRDEVLAAAIDTAKLIASKSPIATIGTKHLLLHARDHTVRDSLEYTATWNSLMLQSDDAKDAFAAFTTKKPTVFKPMPKL